MTDGNTGKSVCLLRVRSTTLEPLYCPSALSFETVPDKMQYAHKPFRCLHAQLTVQELPCCSWIVLMPTLVLEVRGVCWRNDEQEFN